ncbi:MAG: 2OG-Fe(II) oxygenase [Candidatus Marinimicrobia bacterium]|mgnify:FL=1|nr:2OG-Fe(II) oxygenase [Candidatus Neomarinimicrobiota bacterium]|tara:strand:+ start:4676 stop:5509 length:834 start_codon:yes stop_codon:yes gene_type:complete
MNKILTIDYQSSDLGKKLTTSLRNTGFAVIKNHPISHNLIDSIYTEWKDFFSNDAKKNYQFDLVKQDGFFPYLSENAKDSNVKDLKEFFHIYDWGRYPKELSNNTNLLISEFKKMADKLLSEINFHSPNDIKKGYSMPLNEMIKNSSTNLLRVIHYPPLNDNIDPSAIRAGAHEDINLITLLVAGSEPGLQVLSQDGKWVDVSTSSDYIVVNIGDMLQECSGGYFPSTTHRVVNPSDKNMSRYSMPFFVHARDEVMLSKKYTAKSYLEERLKEIGLK